MVFLRVGTKATQTPTVPSGLITGQYMCVSEQWEFT